MEIKEEIRIIEAITAVLGQEVEMANKRPCCIGTPRGVCGCRGIASWMTGCLGTSVFRLPASSGMDSVKHGFGLLASRMVWHAVLDHDGPIYFGPIIWRWCFASLVVLGWRPVLRGGANRLPDEAAEAMLS